MPTLNMIRFPLMRYDHLGNIALTENPMNSNQVLLVDDDVELMELIREYLVQEGFSVAVVYDGHSGIRAALSGDYSIVVLDVMMADINGVEVLKQIRAQSQIPVLMLTAKGDNADRITGLELGADDYVPKPCTARELVARIRAILRRTRQNGIQDNSPEVSSSGQLVMWPGQRRAEWAGHVLNLTSTEFNLLQILLKNAGQAVSRNRLSEEGLGRPLAKYDRSIDVHLTNIRRKLARYPGAQDRIKTVHRRGYQLTVG
jgi:two-component system response regulator CpxR